MRSTLNSYIRRALRSESFLLTLWILLLSAQYAGQGLGHFTTIRDALPLSLSLSPPPPRGLPAYMDEVYHIPQAQRFCVHYLRKHALSSSANGSASGSGSSTGVYWDPKITTLPGLYLISTAFAWIEINAKKCAISAISWSTYTAATAAASGAGAGAGLEGIVPNEPEEEDGEADIVLHACSASRLRLHNVLMAALLLLAAFRCRRSLCSSSSDSSDSSDWHVAGLLCALWPCSALYYGLYYTDTCSTLSLLLTYWLVQSASASASAAASATDSATSAAGATSAKQDDASVLMPRRKIAVVGVEGSGANTGTTAGAGVGAGAGAGASTSAALWRALAICASACLSILCRQTNAAWCLFFAGTRVLTLMRQEGYNFDNPLSSPSSPSSSVSSAPPLRSVGSFLVGLVHTLPVAAACPIFLAAFSPVLLFAYFVVRVNGGHIVVGDKDNHTPGFRHFALLAHALAALAVLLLPFSWGGSGRRERLQQQQPPPLTASDKSRSSISRSRSSSTGGRSAATAGTASATATAAAATTATATATAATTSASSLSLLPHIFGCVLVSLSLVYGSVAHPFLLADNRHYTFYLWKRCLQFPAVRACVGVCYYGLYAYVGEWYFRRSVAGPVVLIGLLLTAAATLVPSPLLEPRYFTPLVVFGLLHAPPLLLADGDTQEQEQGQGQEQEQETGLLRLRPVSASASASVTVACAVLLGLLLADAGLLLVYLRRPFVWGDGTEARFLF